MTRAMRAALPGHPGPRCLRVAMVHDGCIVEEKIHRARGPVSCDGRHVLFERRGDGYVLVLRDGMRARVAGAAETRELVGPATVTLPDDARGRIDTGRAVVLFQSIDPPPVPPRPQLPAAVRGGFLASIDWLFSATSLASFSVFCIFVLFLESADFPIASAAALPDSAVHFILEEPPPPPDDSPVADDTPRDDATDSAPIADASDARRPSDATPRPRPVRTSNDPSLADPETRRAMLLQLGTLLGAGTDGAFDRMMEGAPTTDAATLFADVAGVEQAHARPDALRPRDGCNGPGGLCAATDTDLSHLAASTVRPREADEGRPLDEQVITIRLPDAEIDEPTGRGFFDQRQVTEAVRRRLGAIRRCYEHTLGARGEVSGKVTAEFTIQEVGIVTGVRTVENTTGTPRMSECVERSLRTLRFDPGPEGGSITFRYPFVFAEQR